MFSASRDASRSFAMLRRNKKAGHFLTKFLHRSCQCLTNPARYRPTFERSSFEASEGGLK
jgi:hypothetical protein